MIKMERDCDQWLRWEDIEGAPENIGVKRCRMLVTNKRAKERSGLYKSFNLCKPQYRDVCCKACPL